MTDPLDAFRRQGDIDAAKPLPVPINWKARAEKAECERDALREALERISDMPWAERTSGYNMHSIARTALDAKP